MKKLNFNFSMCHKQSLLRLTLLFFIVYCEIKVWNYNQKGKYCNNLNVLFFTHRKVESKLDFLSNNLSTDD